jgi:hypothetical protein
MPFTLEIQTANGLKLIYRFENFMCKPVAPKSVSGEQSKFLSERYNTEGESL